MSEEEVKIKVTDKRHWVSENEDGELLDDEPKKKLPSYVEQLKEEVEAGKKKLDEYTTAYKSKMDENDEFRARLQNDVDKRVDSGTALILKELIPVVDNLELAIASAKETQDFDKLLEGVLMIKSSLLSVLKDFGMEEIECKGLPFNPNNAEAVAVDEVENKTDDGIVLDLFQPGYKKGDILLRPARVKVGKARIDNE